jgi:hypothetical protein
MKTLEKQVQANSRPGQGHRLQVRLVYFAGGIIALALLLPGGSCNQLRDWRNQQVQTSHNLAASPKVSAPATPVALPSDVERNLPVDATFTVLAYTGSGKEQHCQFLSSWDTQRTIEWLLGAMDARGYTLDDNPSRILEGVAFQNPQAEYPVIKIKVEENLAEQTLITMDSSE